VFPDIVLTSNSELEANPVQPRSSAAVEALRGIGRLELTGLLIYGCPLLAHNYPVTTGLLSLRKDFSAWRFRPGTHNRNSVLGRKIPSCISSAVVLSRASSEAAPLSKSDSIASSNGI
jgi:hypothetical protein